MVLSTRILLSFLTLASSLLLGDVLLGVEGRYFSKRDIHARQLEAGHRFADRMHNPPSRRQVTPGPPGGPPPPPVPPKQNMTFSNPKAKKFLVDGKNIPLVDFDVGPSYAGLLPISGNKNETRQLFFWFFPPGPQGSSDDLIFWTNGGPGCSSLEGFLQENGPISWSYGQAKPTMNPFSWTNLSSVLWVEQPVGTGFSQGVPNIKNEDDLAAQLVGFMNQFLEVFPEMKAKKLYLTGESYAGMYVPYIANYIYEHPGLLDLNLQGIWIADPVLSWNVVQSEITTLAFVKKYQHVFAFNQTFMNTLEQVSATCNYTNYMDTFVTYPPTGLLPLPGKSTFADRGCDIWDMVFNAAVEINPAFNIYRIFDTFPVLWDVLGFPGSFMQTQTPFGSTDSPIYFNRTDVKKAINAPVAVDWQECSDVNVFPHRDTSLPPTFTVLPNVIEKSQRSVIVHGLADFILMADGARIAIQNMTWAGQQGFQTPIANDSFILDTGSSLGNAHVERGLAYVEVALSGHMVPQFSPVAAFTIMQYLMGFRDSL